MQNKGEAYFYSVWSLITFIAIQQRLESLSTTLHWSCTSACIFAILAMTTKTVSCILLHVPKSCGLSVSEASFCPSCAVRRSFRFIPNFFSVWESKSCPWPSSKMWFYTAVTAECLISDTTKGFLPPHYPQCRLGLIHSENWALLTRSFPPNNSTIRHWLSPERASLFGQMYGSSDSRVLTNKTFQIHDITGDQTYCWEKFLFFPLAVLNIRKRAVCSVILSGFCQIIKELFLEETTTGSNWSKPPHGKSKWADSSKCHHKQINLCKICS